MYLTESPTLDRSTRFRDSWVGRLLAADPVRVIDIGARDGFHPMLRQLGKFGAALGFEPDPESYAALHAQLAEAQSFAETLIEPLAIGAGGRAEFHTFSSPTNNSLLPPNLTITGRYAMRKFEHRSSFAVETHRLDDVVFDPTKDLAGFGEFIKLDTQGTEHLILEHAPEVLRSNTVGLVVEVWFCEVYEGQPLFHDLCALLARHGLRFYGFPSFFLRAGKRLDKRSHVGRERALYADAVFVRDPLDHAHPVATPRQAALLIAFAVITGYFDFALELAETFGADDREALCDAIRDFAAADVEAAKADLLQASAAVEAAPGDAMVVIGRFADRWRSGFDYTDVV
jgi:FkbM family methyltransferase